jgi:hypothetical protein
MIDAPLATLTTDYNADGNGNVRTRSWSNGTAQTLTWETRSAV